MDVTNNPTLSSALLTRADAARELATSERHVRRMTEDGRLPSVRLGGLVRIRSADLDLFISTLGTKDTNGR